MSSVSMKRLTSFDYAMGIGYLPVYVNPGQVAYVQPRRRYDSKTDRHSLDGTLVYFMQEAGVLAVKESIAEVVALLQSTGGMCRECHQELPEAWRTQCDDCRRAAAEPHKYANEHQVDVAYEATRADLLP